MIALLSRGVIGALLGALLGGAALAFDYSRHPVLTLEMDRSATVVRGLYGAERAGHETFAWTRDRATMHLPQLDRRVEWTCGIRLRGGRSDVSTLPEVVIAVDGVIAATAQSTNEYQDLSVPLPARPLRPGATITLTSSTTFVPGPGDPRTLGVIVDRWTCAPASPGRVRPPWRATAAAAAAAAAFAAAFAFVGAGVVTIAAAVVLLGIAQAVPLGWEFGPFTPYTDRAVWLALSIAALLVASVRLADLAIGRRSSGAARLVAGGTAVVVYLKLLALLHPSKAVIDAVFHAHRLQWVLDGRFFFTQPMPSGVQFPYAIGLYVFAAPWSLLTADYVLLLRILVSVAEATGAVLVYLLISRLWQDRLAGVIAALLFHLVPRTFEIVGNANMTNAFGQSLAFCALSAAVLWPLQRRHWGQVTALTLLTAWALLSHISTFTLLGAILSILAALLWFKGRGRFREPAVSIAIAVLIAAGLAMALYYAHFGDAYRTAARVRAAAESETRPQGPGDTIGRVPPARPAGRPDSPPRLREAGRLTVAAVGWPIFVMGLIGAVPLWRRGLDNRLSLAVLALILTFVLFVVSVVAAPVERSFQRYAAEFISRVTLATYPAMVMLAGLGMAWAWRAGWPARAVALGLVLAALYVGVVTWVDWLR